MCMHSSEDPITTKIDIVQIIVAPVLIASASCTLKFHKKCFLKILPLRNTLSV